MKIDRKKFFDGFRDAIDSSIDQKQVGGLEFLLGKIESDPLWKDGRNIAYALATVYHETAGSFQPVEAGYYLGSQRRVQAFQKTLRYFPYYGRGYVQLTWPQNYKKAGKAFGIDLVNKPELALDPEIAYKVLTAGMHEGWFTGKKLSDYIHGSTCDYKNARRIINGVDKAALIAGYARTFEKILKDSAAVPASNTASSISESSLAGGSASAESASSSDGQPPNITEVKTTEAVQVEDKTLVTEQTATAPKGEPADAPPTKVTKAGPLSKWLFSSGGALTIFTGIWGFITTNGNVIGIAILVLGLLICALIVRGAITDAIRMTAAADPDKNNVT